MLAPDELRSRTAFIAIVAGFFAPTGMRTSSPPAACELGLHAPAEACHQRTVAALRQRRRDVDRGALRAARFQAGYDLQDRASPARRA